MKEISMRIPDGTRKVTVEIGDDGTAVARYEKPEVKVEENQLLFACPCQGRQALERREEVHRGLAEVEGEGE